MVEEYVREKLDWFKADKYKRVVAGESIILTEKKKDGNASLQCMLTGESIIFTSPEKNVLRYLDEQKKGATACADAFIFMKDNEGLWNLHIIEFKKKIDTSSFAYIMHQFTMGIYNARAVASFLGFDINKIWLYSGFRDDSISKLDNTQLIAIRVNALNYEIVKMWNNGKCNLKIDGKECKIEHFKIQLDNDGNGTFSI